MRFFGNSYFVKAFLRFLKVLEKSLERMTATRNLDNAMSFLLPYILLFEELPI